MIAILRGRVVNRGVDWAIIDVGGVGFRVFVPATTAAALPPVGEETTLHVHTHLRENTLALYGFVGEDELRLFEQIIGVSGMGPKLALTALSTLRPDEFRRAVVEEDAATLTRIPGIGRKTAQRIILELKGKLEAPVAADVPVETAAFAPVDSDAVAALVALGYAEVDAVRAVRAARRASPATDDAARLVRLALRELAPTME